MTHPVFHARTSARLFGGTPADYLAVHRWLDDSKRHFADVRHHEEGVAEAVRVLGPQVAGVPTRLVAEAHVREDCFGRVPRLADWLAALEPQEWMGAPAHPGAGARDGAQARCSKAPPGTAEASAELFGGEPRDYAPVHRRMDADAGRWPGPYAHRVTRHHAEGIFACEQAQGVCCADGVPVRYVTDRAEHCADTPPIFQYGDGPLSHPASSRKRLRLPRPRGDGPAPSSSAGDWREAPPPTRG